MPQIPNCKRFSGYKPCYPDHDCYENGCIDPLPLGTRILIINLDAMGDVLMSTAQLPGLKRKFPVSTVTWITDKSTVPLLKNNPLINRVFAFDAASILILSQLTFDYVLNVDKSQRACALTNSVRAENKLGFGLNENGVVYPLNDGAYYNYHLGMDDHFKFKVNQRTGQDYLAETFELEYRMDDYVFLLTPEEQDFCLKYRAENGISPNDLVIGFNTGCSELYPNKKMTVEQHRTIISALLEKNAGKILLLGGADETERNSAIAQPFGDSVIQTPTREGVRRGACYENCADVIVTGDSFGMHLAIALKKYVIAWFGLSCWTEIEMYGRGVKLFPDNLHCAPCWKKQCPHNLECISSIDLHRIVAEIIQYATERFEKK